MVQPPESRHSSQVDTWRPRCLSPECQSRHTRIARPERCGHASLTLPNDIP